MTAVPPNPPETDESPAGTIRSAVELLRGRAAAARDGRWSVIEIRDADPFGFPARVLANWATGRGTATAGVADARRKDAEFIALMQPGVAAALADWLEAELLMHQQAGVLASAAASGEIHIGGSLARVEVGMSTLDKALAVARAVAESGAGR